MAAITSGIPILIGCLLVLPIIVSELIFSLK